MQTVANNIKGAGAKLVDGLAILLGDDSPLRDINRPSSDVVFVGPHYAFEDLPLDMRRLQSRLNEDHQHFVTIVRALVRTQSDEVRKKIDEHAETVREVIEQTDCVWHSSTGKAMGAAKQAIDQILDAISCLHDPAEGSTVLVPDTNALIRSPAFQAWRFEAFSEYEILLVPTLLSELDTLKNEHRNAEVRAKAQSVIRQIKELSLPQSWNRYSYAWNNPILLMDPDGQAVQLMGKTAEDREKELDAIKESLDDEEAADKLYINEEGIDADGNTVWNDPDATPTGNYFVGVQGELGDFAKSSPVAGQLADVVGHKQIVGFSLTSKDLSAHGGASTSPSWAPGNRTGNPLVRINPSQIGSAGGVMQNLKTAVSHELYGHALGGVHGIRDPGYNPFGKNNNYAVQQENIARKWYSRKAPGQYPPRGYH